jgi:hypothetical protein
MSSTDPVEMNIRGVQSLVGSRLNKINRGINEHDEGIDGEIIDELTLDLSDEKLLLLSKQWEAKYAPYEGKIKLRQQANKSFYLGRQKDGSALSTAIDGTAISDNIIWEAEETFIPAALAKNPEPVVYSDDTKEGNELADTVKTMLQYHADTLELRGMLSLGVRQWSVDLLACFKHGWDDEIKEIKFEDRDVKKFVFDPEGYVDVYGDFVGYLGERITVTAEKLIDINPKHKDFITVMVDGKLGTSVTYTQWWNDDYTFETFKNRILFKGKNPHFNREKKEKGTESATPAKNHFARPKKPYTFLSVYTFGDSPHDVTGLIEQNIPNQRLISRRTEQIDYNLSRQNNSDVFSEDNFNQETGKQAAKALAAGHPVLVPAGRPLREAIDRLPAQGLDNSFFVDLENRKNTLRTAFGTQGITAQPQKEEMTARGMILNNQHDSSRIGGGIGDVLERVAKNVFNWWVQMYYVYYDEPHYASIIGSNKSVEFVQLSTMNLNKRLVVTVSPDSMKSHDEITEMNQAIQLYEAGVLDPKTLLTMVSVPDPQSTAESTVLWLLDKQAYLKLNFPELMEKMQALQAQMQPQAEATPENPAGQQIANQQQTPPETTGIPAAGASLSQVPLPQ